MIDEYLQKSLMVNVNTLFLLEQIIIREIIDKANL